MTSLVFHQDREIAMWVAERIPSAGPDSFADAVAIGVQVDGRLVAGVVYDNYFPRYQTIELSMAADSPIWARKETIAELLRYPFRQLGVFKVWTCTPIENDLAIKVNEHIGFKREATLAHHYGRKKHAVICRMLEPTYSRVYENGRQISTICT